MAAPTPVPADRFRAGDFAADCSPDDLVYFLLNVGDGDAQLVLLPAEQDGTRPALVEALSQTPLLPARHDLFPVVVGTHPHEDHIAGMPEFLDDLGDFVREYGEPRYYHPSASYMETMRALE